MFCTTVPYFGTTVSFLHYCSAFSQQNKNGTVYFVPLFRVFVPLFRFCTTVPFFCTTVPYNRTKTEQCILYHCFVILYLCSVFQPLFRFSKMEQKRNSVSSYQCSVFFALLFRFPTTEQKRISVFCTTVPCFCITVPFLHHCSVFALLFRFLHYHPECLGLECLGLATQRPFIYMSSMW